MDIKIKDNSQLKPRFTQLEYIESSGTQYIDTGIKPVANDEFEVTYMITGTTGNYNSVFGTRVSPMSNAFMFGYTSSGSYIELGDQNISSFNKGYSQNVKHTIKLENGNLYVDNVLDRSITINQNTVHNLLLFTLNSNGTPSEFSKCKIYNFTIKRAGVKVLELVPVINDNVLCLYDTVSKTFFYNQGTGNFTAGPVVKHALPEIVKHALPENILLKTTTLYHKNTPNVNGLQLLNGILNYQKTHQDEIKEYYYPTTQLWQNIVTEYPDILYWYNINHKFCIYICEADDPEQCTEDFLDGASDIQQELEDYPDLIPIVAENPSLAPIVAENPEVVHSLVDTGYETWLHNNGTAYLITQLSFQSGIRLCGKFYFISLVSNSYISIAGTYNGKHNILRVNQGPNLQVCINSNSSLTDKLEYRISLNTKYDLDLSNRVSAYIKINGSTVASANFSGDIAPTPIAIFAITRYDSSIEKQIGTLKSSAIKLYDIDDNVVLWLAPIQNNGNPCMIDLLTGTKYLNQGTGSFTYSLEPKNA